MLQISIAALSSTENAKLTNELTLVKSALLYADKVTLCSGPLQMMLALNTVQQLDLDEALVLIERVMAFVVPTSDDRAFFRQYIQLYKLLKGMKSLTPEEESLKAELDSALVTGIQATKVQFDAFMQTAGVSELNYAMDAGLLELQSFNGNWGPDAVVSQYVNYMIAVVTEGTSMPLFDDISRDTFLATLKLCGISISSADKKRTKPPALALNGFNRLPNFENATVDEILDIREELDPYVIPFRSAMIDFSNDIQAASWDKDFDKEAELIFMSKIEPQIFAIERECLGSTRYKEFLRKPGTFYAAAGGGAALGAMIAPMIDSTVVLGMFLGGAAGAILQMKEERLHNKANKNQLYLYYSVKDRIQ